MRHLLTAVGLCLFAVIATLAALGFVLWLLVVDRWEWVVFRFKYGWSAKITPTRWL